MPSIHIPTSPLYTNASGQDIYWIEGANAPKRSQPGGVELLVIHDTAGSDSRDYLRSNARRVSATYLVGTYRDTNGPRIYKYMSEANNAPQTQGPALVGGIRASNCNEVSVSIEIEEASLDKPTIATAALLAAEILRGWRERGRYLVMVPHHIIQGDKSDPRLDWHAWCEQVYN